MMMIIKIIEDFDCKEILDLLKKQKENGEKLNINTFPKICYLLCLNANNLFGWSMTQPLPIVDFRWDDPEKFVRHKERGYVAEVNLEYTKKF
jgi:hypothetical protein